MRKLVSLECVVTKVYSDRESEEEFSRVQSLNYHASGLERRQKR